MEVKGTTVSLKARVPNETRSDATTMGRSTRENGMPRDFRAISSLPAARPVIPRRALSSEDMGKVMATTSGRR